MILSCNFEEILALRAGAELLLAEGEEPSGSGVAAPADTARIGHLVRGLDQPRQLSSLAEVREIAEAVERICVCLHERLDAAVLELHPAHEQAVSLYFDYAHAYAVFGRLQEAEERMTALIELISGAPPTDETARSITFPD